MKTSKFLSSVLALGLGAASMFCYVECALAMPQTTEKGCSGQCEKQTPVKQQDPGELCCPAFLAVSHALPNVHLQAPQSTDFEAPFFALIPKSSSVKINFFSFSHYFSPPPVFAPAHSIHAPPALL